MRNKVALALLVLAASIGLAACGGSQSPDVLGSATTGPRLTRDGRPPRTDPRKSCEAQGVNSTTLFPGACTEGGIQYVVANFGGIYGSGTLTKAGTGEYRLRVANPSFTGKWNVAQGMLEFGAPTNNAASLGVGSGADFITIETSVSGRPVSP